MNKRKLDTDRLERNNTLAYKLYDHFNKETGIDIFRNTRKREYVEARAVFNFVLYNVHNLGLNDIARFYKANKKNYDHATVYHSLNNFDVYNLYSKEVSEWLHILEDYAKGDAKRSLCKKLINKLSKEKIEETYTFIKNQYKDEAEVVGLV